MSLEDKLRLWTSLPVPAQKLLVGTSACVFKIGSDANPRIVKPISKLTDEEFEVVKQVLSKTPFFSETEAGRLKIAQSMKDFINTDLTRIWEEQAAREQKK